jgi:hypothetical protein
LKPAEYLLYVFISNLKFYFFLKFEATTILTQGVIRALVERASCPPTAARHPCRAPSG